MTVPGQAGGGLDRRKQRQGRTGIRPVSTSLCFASSSFPSSGLGTQSPGKAPALSSRSGASCSIYVPKLELGNEKEPEATTPPSLVPALRGNFPHPPLRGTFSRREKD